MSSVDYSKIPTERLNPRAKGLDRLSNAAALRLMDAEDALVVAQWPSVVQYIDAISLIGQSRWVERQADIDALLPAMGAVRTFITHWGRLAY